MFCVLILPGQRRRGEDTGSSFTDASVSSIAEPLPAVCFPDCVLHSEDQGKPSVSFWVSRGQFMSDGG